MTIDVSVIVPVYNPGRFIETCIDGYLTQSLPAARREIIFVDDGSTDDTPARLDRLARAHPDVQVIHQENSGWPGKPRNVGIEAARGDYVFFCDHDDRLEVEALERMVATARRTGADVLLPKTIGHHRRGARYRANIDNAHLIDGAPMASLTPHKLLRRAFLNETGLRFPEGKRRLEDQVFIVEAYLRANVITILADYPCYHRMKRDDGGNAAYQKWDAEYYYSFVGEVIDVIEANTEPGELRDNLLMRPFAGEMLGRLTDTRMFKRDPQTRAEVFTAVRRLAVDRFPPEFYQRLPIVPRAHARALLEDRPDLLEDIAARSASIRGAARLRDLSWDNGSWVASIDAELTHADGSPIRITPLGEEWLLDPRLVPAELDSGPHPTKDVLRGWMDIYLRHHKSDVEWSAPAQVKSELVAIDGDPDRAHRLVVRGIATIDPATLAGGSPLDPGRWDLKLRMVGFGVRRISGASEPPGAKDLPGPALFPTASVVAPSFAGRDERLAFKVTPPGKELTSAAVARVSDVVLTSPGHLVVGLDLAVAPGAVPPECSVVLVNAATRAVVGRRPAQLAPTSDGSLVTSLLIGKRRLPHGRLSIGIRLAKQGGPQLVGVVDVGRFGRLIRAETRSAEPLKTRRMGLSRQQDEALTRVRGGMIDRLRPLRHKLTSRD